MILTRKIVAWIILLYSLPVQLDGQLNIFTGLSGDYFYQQPISPIVSNYNKARPWLSDPLKDFNSIMGLQMGLRYKFEMIGFMGGIKLGTKKRKASGTSPVLDAVEEKVKMANNIIFLGTEIFMDPTPLSFGASLGYSSIKIDHTQPTTDDQQLILNSSNWSTEFFLSLNLGGAGTKLSIRPFWNMAWKESDFSALVRELQVEVPESKFKLNSLGISLLLFNG